MARHQIPSDKTIKSLKISDAPSRLSDGDGLYLIPFVKGGSHGWRFDYSFAGRRKTLSLGTYPDTGLALARQKAGDARQSVAAGVNPSDLRKQAKLVQVAAKEDERRIDAGLPGLGTFEAVACDWLNTIHRVKVSSGQANRTLVRLQQDIFPWLGSRPIGEIQPKDLLECLRRVESRGAIETAHRARQACGQIFRYGVASGMCERDVAFDLRDALTPVSATHHPAIVDPKRVGELLRAIDAYKGTPVVRAALRFMALVFQRPGEVRQAEWTEFDLDASTWRIPAGRMKRTKAGKAEGPDHEVPLSTQAVAVLRELHPLTGNGRHVFPSLRKGDRPMSDNAVLTALRTMGFPKEEMTGHGFRAMARTMLAERLDVDEQVIEAQLAHAVQGSLGRAYNRTQFMEQRRTMMQLWADYLDGLRHSPTQAARFVEPAAAKDQLSDRKRVET